MLKRIYQSFSILDYRDKKGLIYIIIIIIMMGIIETASIGGILPLMQILSEPSSFKGGKLVQYIPRFPSEDLFLNLIIIVMMLFIVRFFLGVYVYYKFYDFTYGKNYKYSSLLLGFYAKRPYELHLTKNGGVLLKNVINEVNLYINLLLQTLIIISEIIVLMLLLLLLLFVNFEVVILLMLFCFILSAIIIYTAKKKIAVLGARREEHNGLFYKYASELLNGLKIIKVMGQEQWFLNKYIKSAKLYSHANVIFHVTKDLPRFVIETIGLLSMLGFIGYAIVSGAGVASIIPIASLFAMAGLRIMPSINRINSSIVQIKFYERSAEVMRNEFGVERLRDSPRMLIKMKQTLKITNICFKYPNSDNLAVDSINITLNRGEKVGFVGFSGSGKTTLMDIILGLLKPQDGLCEVDGKTLGWDQLHGLVQTMAYIPQDTFLIDDTVAANVALGEELIDSQRLRMALRSARLEEWLLQCPMGIDTLVGDKGVQLSGGQKQRISIARALYRDPDILIMDEATSALDNVTESEFLEILDDLSREKTILIVAHRLSTIEHCDRIYVMEKGRIIAEDSHVNLLETSEVYKKLNSTFIGNVNDATH